MAADPVPIVIAGTRETDQFPSRHVAVAAIDWIGEKAFLSILQEQREEARALDVLEHN